jgi:hypothetical protein
LGAIRQQLRFNPRSFDPRDCAATVTATATAMAMAMAVAMMPMVGADESPL